MINRKGKGFNRSGHKTGLVLGQGLIYLEILMINMKGKGFNRSCHKTGLGLGQGFI